MSLVNTLLTIKNYIFGAVFLFSIFSCKEDTVKIEAYTVLETLVGDRINEFELSIVANKDNKPGDFYTLKATPNKVEIQGSSNTAICYAANNYLKEIGAAHVSWEGIVLNVPKQWPEYSKEGSTPFAYRKYLNVCTFGYTTPWWNWDRWEQEINWMALHGVNMPTAMEGQEAVWQQLWKEYGLTDTELKQHFAGPAFLPWQRMGNINSHAGELPQNWINKKAVLQKKILLKMRDLGMKPVVPGFSGYIPKALASKYKEANISTLDGWSGGGFESTFLLDPKDPLFKEIGKRFIEIYTEKYGESDFYLADAFNEITPPVSKENKNKELEAYGKVLFETINEAAPNATWVMQGWLFGHDKEFWTKEATTAFLNKVPNDKMLIQDFGNDRYKVWEELEAFYGKQWTYGYVHNYGGSNPLYGDLEFYKKELENLLATNKKGKVLGYGVMPEGLDNNTIILSFYITPIRKFLKRGVF